MLCCRHISRKTLLEELFLVTLLVYRCEFMYRFFLMCCETLEESFFQSALVDCFFKERILLPQGKNVKQKRMCFCNYWGFQEILRRDVFHPGVKYFYGKYSVGWAGIPPWTSGIPYSRDGMKNVRASYKRNSKFLKKWL